MVGACDVSPGPPLHTSLHSIRRKIRPNGSRTLCEHTRSTELWCRVFHVAMVPRAVVRRVMNRNLRVVIMCTAALTT